MEIKSKLLLLFSIIIFLSDVVAQQIQNTATLNLSKAHYKISRYIYGHFSEHLGHCIYGGFWVSENSTIPNVRGIRIDVVKAMRNIKAPILRWPGGCFADEYHWMDGIGDPAKRPKTVNTTWGGVTEDNSFGTNEFMDFCKQLGCEPVICGNLGSGTVNEMSDWLEYLTSDGNDPMSNLRKANGREEPWKIKYWGMGNESWGCGGIMSSEFYSNEAARYSFFAKTYGEETLYKIFSSGLPEDYEWTETIMKKWSETDGWLQGYMSGYSLHFYTVNDWNHKGSATDFTEDDWFATISRTLTMDELITKHSAIMDKYDPDKKIGLVVDEWGNWFDVEPETNPAFLYQQNSLRDAMVAALNLNIFHKHARVYMANIAQMVNVLQSLILTDKEKMILTPTYFVYKMYKDFQDATYLPIELSSEKYKHSSESIDAVSASCAITKEGKIILSLVNVNAAKDIDVSCMLNGITPKNISGEILSAGTMNAHNTFKLPNDIHPEMFLDFSIKDDGSLSVHMPSKSIIVLEWNQE